MTDLQMDIFGNAVPVEEIETKKPEGRKPSKEDGEECTDTMKHIAAVIANISASIHPVTSADTNAISWEYPRQKLRIFT